MKESAKGRLFEKRGRGEREGGEWKRRRREHDSFRRDRKEMREGRGSGVKEVTYILLLILLIFLLLHLLILLSCRPSSPPPPLNSP